jgi:DNA-binding MarR family transcriptional regulator
MSCPADVAGLLAGLRKASKRARFDAGIPLVAAEALLWIAAGIDNLPDLQRHMGLSPAQGSRTLSLLRGRGRLEHGKWIESPIGLVQVSAHPHRRGYRIQLTEEAQQLLASTFAPVKTTPGDQ